jgi:two-component sensor histidine kinase
MLYRHPDGRSLTFEVSSVPVRDRAGAIAAAVTALVDVTERRRTEVHLQLLTTELSHRVKNTLAVVQGLAMQTILLSKSLEEFDDAFQGRLDALGKAHGMLLSTQWEGLDLTDLARAELAALGAVDEAVSISGPSVTLGPRQGLSMALMLHELATNAAKHGALAVPGGRVELSWSLRADDPVELELTWVERRPGGVAQAGPRGFGTVLIRRSAEHELGGQADLVMTGEGVRWTLRFPVGRTDAFRKAE